MRMGLFFLVITMALWGFSLGAVHKVGDSAGWSPAADYQKWASSNTFHVGDTLVFEYNKQLHNVKQVKREDFESCNAASPIATYTTGSDSISLKSRGDYYFCGFAGHCQAGQKVHVKV
ncbi:mavicyanin-like [Carica papaya]|uniref:mavicyanin-like n=1 Tax=Carica papaya TaxID=3649 RepID=UPI000B8C8E9F|nr:mavicyanin-like [Carica papaya]